MKPEIREIIPGRYYRHFKGRVYRVVGIALHSETSEHMVVYQAKEGDGQLFVRPYGMFASEADRQKYPEAAQRDRFELMS